MLTHESVSACLVSVAIGVYSFIFVFINSFIFFLYLLFLVIIEAAVSFFVKIRDCAHVFTPKY